jgi:hypothetical protein
MTIFRHRVTGPGLAGDDWVSTFFSSSTNSIATVHTAWSNMVTAFVTTSLQAMWNTHTQISEVFTDQLDPLTFKNVAQSQSALSIVGTGTGGSVSPTNCIVVSKLTALPQKKGRGRMFWPSPDDTHYTTGGLLVQADCATVATAFKNAATSFSASATPVLFHRPDGTTIDIANYKVGDKPGQQRRRINKVVNTYSIA